MSDSPIIRPARPDDAPLAAVTFRLSMGEFADHLFGSDGRAAEMALIKLFSRNAGRFGYEHAAVIEHHKRALGMLISFPGKEIQRLNFASVRFLPMALGTRTFGFIFRLLGFASIREAEMDEYYISNIAVLPAAHGQGYGPRLLNYADEQARALGLSKCSLMVSPNNKVAMRLYKKHGYEIVSTHQHKNPIASYHRMVKILTTNHQPSTTN